MDKAKGLVKGGWHPPGDPSIHRKTWKSDIKGMATGKKDDKKHYENAISHQSAPLSGLKDPDSFGPPPKHKEFYDEQGNSLNPVTPAGVARYTTPERAPQRPVPSGGWGSVVPTPNRKQQEEEQKQQEVEAREARGPYKADTTGLRTDNLPAPPLRRDAPAPPPRSNSGPASPPLPQRQPQARAVPIPTLPPRMSEHPDEYTPPAPPSYNEATSRPAQQNPAALNTGAVSRLSQAGVSVPGFGIGSNSNGPQQSPTSPQGHTGQLSELQQRFARMRTGSDAQAPAPASPTSSNPAAVSAAAHKKPPPPPPPKKSNLTGAMPTPPGSADGSGAPPPLPMSSKPRPN